MVEYQQLRMIPLCVCVFQDGAKRDKEEERDKDKRKMETETEQQTQRKMCMFICVCYGKTYKLLESVFNKDCPVTMRLTLIVEFIQSLH